MRNARGRRGGGVPLVAPPTAIFANVAQWIVSSAGITYGTPPAISGWTDQGPNGNTPVQGTAAQRPSLVSGFVDFDGTDDSLVSADNGSLDFVTSFTIGVACRFDTLGTIQVVASKGAASADNAWSLQMDTTNLRMLIDGITNLGYVTPAAAGTWGRYIFRYDGGGVGNAQRLRAWKNGVEGITHTGTIPASITNGATQDVRFGRWAGSVFQYLDGAISSYVSTGIAGTDAQILALDRYLATTHP